MKLLYQSILLMLIASAVYYFWPTEQQTNFVARYQAPSSSILAATGVATHKQAPSSSIVAATGVATHKQAPSSSILAATPVKMSQPTEPLSAEPSTSTATQPVSSLPTVHSETANPTMIASTETNGEFATLYNQLIRHMRNGLPQSDLRLIRQQIIAQKLPMQWLFAQAGVLQYNDAVANEFYQYAFMDTQEPPLQLERRAFVMQQTEFVELLQQCEPCLEREFVLRTHFAPLEQQSIKAGQQIINDGSQHLNALYQYYQLSFALSDTLNQTPLAAEFTAALVQAAQQLQYTNNEIFAEMGKFMLALLQQNTQQLSQLAITAQQFPYMLALKTHLPQADVFNVIMARLQQPIPPNDVQTMLQGVYFHAAYYNLTDAMRALEALIKIDPQISATLMAKTMQKGKTLGLTKLSSRWNKASYPLAKAYLQPDGEPYEADQLHFIFANLFMGKRRGQKLLDVFAKRFKYPEDAAHYVRYSVNWPVLMPHFRGSFNLMNDWHAAVAALDTDKIAHDFDAIILSAELFFNPNNHNARFIAEQQYLWPQLTEYDRLRLPNPLP